MPHVSDIITQHGFAARLNDLHGEPIPLGLLSDLPRISTYLLQALSASFIGAIVYWAVNAVRRRRVEFVTRTSIVIMMWVASIATAAAAHTLDVWRYLIPSVPMVGLTLSLLVAELADAVVPRRRG